MKKYVQPISVTQKLEVAKMLTVSVNSDETGGDAWSKKQPTGGWNSKDWSK